MYQAEKIVGTPTSHPGPAGRSCKGFDNNSALTKPDPSFYPPNNPTWDAQKEKCSNIVHSWPDEVTNGVYMYCCVM